VRFQSLPNGPSRQRKELKENCSIQNGGFQQVAKFDFNDTFAQIVHWNTSIHSCFACVMKLGHLTIVCKKINLNKNLEEEVYMTILEGNDNEKLARKLYRLVKALYCFKQAPRTWYSQIDDHL
jgi:hypothetical protein